MVPNQYLLKNSKIPVYQGPIEKKSVKTQSTMVKYK